MTCTEWEENRCRGKKKQKTKEEHSGRKKGKCKGPEARMEKKEINGWLDSR